MSGRDWDRRSSQSTGTFDGVIDNIDLFIFNDPDLVPFFVAELFRRYGGAQTLIDLWGCMPGYTAYLFFH